MAVGKEDVRAFIASQRYGVVSSIGRNRTPESALVGIAVMPGLEIVFDTLEQSRKGQNLLVNKACSIVIGLEEPITVQYEGRAGRHGVEEEGDWKKVYFAAFPDGRERMKWPGLVYFVVRPKWIRYSDFSERSRRIQEFSFDGD